MFFSLDVIRARKGDCLMVHYGTKDDRHLMLIDGGPRGVYGPNLKPHIEVLKASFGLDKKQPLPVDVLMVSHVDDDHIQGILDLTKELITSSMEKTKPLVNIAEMWHNSFENIIKSDTGDLTASFKSQFGPASTSTELPPDITIEAGDQDEEVILWNLKALASIEQGAQLRHDAEKLKIPLNPIVSGGLFIAKDKAKPLSMDGLTITLLGPMGPEIENLRQKHQDWLKDLKAKGKTPEEALAAYVDKSVPNLSSIVMLVEAGPKNAKKRILLTGDARGDKILEGLELAKLLKPGGKINVDILKVPHHGSSNNLDNDFFERIIAKHYVFSGDGEHGNPERETMEMLWKARGDADYQVHLTYPVKDIDKERKADWEKEQNKEKKKKLKNPKIKLRANWSPAKHSLQGVFDKNGAFAKKLRIVDPAKPHLINLLDALEL
jgi:beta-lactamase superfamily II metal-dependent hydrolase